MKKNITNKLVSSLKPEPKPYEVRDMVLKGLILRVQPSGSMNYYLEYERGKRIKLAPADALTPFEVREKAKKELAEYYNGQDLADNRRKAKAKPYKQYLDEDYKPWLENNLRSGLITHDRLNKAFPEFHKLQLHEITHWLCEKWKQRRTKDGVKATTINRELADLKALLRRATSWGIIDKHPLEHVKLCKVDSNPVVRYLDKDEEKNLRDALNAREDKIRLQRNTANQWRLERQYDPFEDLSELVFADYLKPVVLLSLNTGLRRGEIFGLEWTEVDLSNRMMTVSAENSKAGKTRHIPLNEEAFQVLRDWKNQSINKTGFVFHGKDGKPFHDVRKAWAKVLKEAPVIKFRWHDLRHTFASKLVQAGVDLNTVRELLGHSDYKMTLRYAHLAPEQKAEAVSKLQFMGA